MSNKQKKKRAIKTPEQKLLEQAEKEKRAAEKVLSEEEIVKRYAARVIANQGYHGRVDKKKFSNLASKNTVNKQLWMDTDFYFTICFQSGTQKDKFLKEFTKKFGAKVDEVTDGGIQIVNGMQLARMLGIELEKETSKEYPLPDLDLREFVLDAETM